MELKEFIKEVLNDVVLAVKESQEELITSNAVINPRVTVNKGKVIDKEYALSKDFAYCVQAIDFEVALCDETGSENKRGIGVFLANIGAGIKDKENVKTSSVTNIKFSIPVILPSVPNYKIREIQPVN
jgi:hypothetical protein